LGYKIVEQSKTVDDQFFDKLIKVIQLKAIDEVIVADQGLARSAMAQLIEFSKTHHLDFKFAADIFDSRISHISMRPLAGIPLVELQRTPLQGWGRIFKRLSDVGLATIAIIIFSPLLLATALGIRLTSPGPVIYRNRRVGEAGREFDTLKFRSMKQEYCIGDQFTNNEAALLLERQLIQERSIKSGPLYKIQDDPRVTKFGAFIRRTSLDEFPQFFNVLKGDMSLVGPRPHQPREVAQYHVSAKAILGMKPGITGLAQISGRSDLAFEEEIRLDSYYMENWSILLDVYILFKTPLVLLRKRTAL
jgi:exopolysaccharide biosynthesis polyprenyl glycosylphosphotransferase